MLNYNNIINKLSKDKLTLTEEQKMTLEELCDYEIKDVHFII